MSKEPKPVVEVYELMRRIQNEEKVSQEEVGYHLNRALKSKDSRGTWIRREVDTREASEAVSVLEIDTKKSLVGLRLSSHSKKKGPENTSKEV